MFKISFSIVGICVVLGQYFSAGSECYNYEADRDDIEGKDCQWPLEYQQPIQGTNLLMQGLQVRSKVRMPEPPYGQDQHQSTLVSLMKPFHPAGDQVNAVKHAEQHYVNNSHGTQIHKGEGGGDAFHSSGTHTDEHHSHSSGTHAEEHHSHSSGTHAEEQHSHGPDCESEAATSVALLLIFLAIIIPVLALMLSKGNVTRQMTMALLDNFLAIFLAVLWFSVVWHFMNKILIKHPIIYAGCILIVIYMVVVLLCYHWRDDDDRIKLSVCSSIGAHYTAFTGIGIGAAMQGELASEMKSMNYIALSKAASFLICLFVFVIWAAVHGITHVVFHYGRPYHHHFRHAISEIEVDVAGLVISYLLTKAVLHAMLGYYPESLLQEGQHITRLSLTQMMGGPHDMHVSNGQICMLLGWTAALFVICVCVFKSFQPKAFHGHYTKVFIYVIRVLCVMSLSWSMLLSSEWLTLHKFFVGHPLFGHEMLTLVLTTVCLALIWLLSSLAETKIEQQQAITSSKSPGRFGNSRQLHGVARHVSGPLGRLAVPEGIGFVISGLSLVIAWSWEHWFNKALDIVGQALDLGFDGLIFKAAIAMILPALVLPIYMSHVKPEVVQAHIQEEQEDESD